MVSRWRVVWWQLRGQLASRWIGLAAGGLVSLLASVGWVEVTTHSGELNGTNLVQGTALLLLVALIAAGALGAAVMWRYRYQVGSDIAERGFLAFLRTLLVVGLVAFAFGIFIHGGRFLHIDVVLKLIGLAKGD